MKEDDIVFISLMLSNTFFLFMWMRNIRVACDLCDKKVPSKNIVESAFANLCKECDNIEGRDRL